MTAGYVAGDKLFYWDNTNSVLKSIDMTHLIAAVLALGRPGLTALTALAGSGVATDDELLIGDTSATTIKKMLMSELKIALATTLGLVSIDKIFDAKGDLAAGTGADASAKLTVGSDGTVLIADSGQTAGLRYGDPNSLVQGVNAQTGTTYTIATTDPGQLITCSNASAITVTVPQDSAVTFAIGKWCEIIQLGAGQVTVSAGSGATLRATPTAKARAQYSRLFLQKISANTWHLAGDIAAT
jgi:hypothetical protein